MITLGFTACSDVAPPPSLQAVFQAVEAGMFEGIDENTEAELEIASRQLGPFQQVKQLNFMIENGIYKDMRANVIIGQYVETEEWEVIRIMVKNHGSWQIVPRIQQEKQ